MFKFSILINCLWVRAAIFYVTIGLAFQSFSLAQQPPTHDGINLIQETLDVAIGMRANPHPELRPFRGNFDVNMVKVSQDGFVMKMQLPNNSGFFHIHLIICKPDIHSEFASKVIDAVILGPLETADHFYEANLLAKLPRGADFIVCQPGGFEFSWTKGELSESRTRILNHLGGLLRYFLEYKPNPSRGGDLLRVAAIHWREELQELNFDKDLRGVVLGLKLIDMSFPFDQLDGIKLDPRARSALHDLLTTTVFLRKKLSVLDTTIRTNIARDESLLARFR